MPTPFLKKFSKEHNMTMYKAEKIWDKAKEKVKSEGTKESDEGFYAIVMTIFKNIALNEESVSGDIATFTPPLSKEVQKRKKKKVDFKNFFLEESKYFYRDQPQQEATDNFKALQNSNLLWVFKDMDDARSFAANSNIMKNVIDLSKVPNFVGIVVSTYKIIAQLEELFNIDSTAV